MLDLENIVNKLSDSFEKFKPECMKISYDNALGRTRLSSTQGRGVGGVSAAGGGAAAATPSASEGSWPVDAGQHIRNRVRLRDRVKLEVVMVLKGRMKIQKTMEPSYPTREGDPGKQIMERVPSQWQGLKLLQ